MMNLRQRLACLLFPVAIGPCLFAAEAPIPLEDFFRDATFDEIKLSPDGSKVAALAQWKDHLNLYVIDLKTKQPKMLTGLDTMDVQNVIWVGDGQLVFTGRAYGYPTGGLFAVDTDGRKWRTLGKSIGQQVNKGSLVYRDTSFLDLCGDSTDEILVVSNERRELDPDVYRMNIHTGLKRIVATNPGGVERWVADHDGVVRAAQGLAGREQFLLYRDGVDDEWREVHRSDFTEGGITPLAFDADNQLLYVLSDLGRNTQAIALFDPEKGEIVRELCANDTYDMGDVLLSRGDHALLGFACDGEKPAVEWADHAFKQLQAMLDQELPGRLNRIYSRSHDNTWMIIKSSSDRDPGTFFLLNTKELTMEKLVSRMEWIKPEQMAEMKPITYQARDGLTIHGYLTLPPGREPKNLPLIVNPHGGPWYRDSWGYIPEVQFLASRGYAVLQMNFRGSTGYGRKLLEAGYGQWGLTMQDDITDGVKWAISQGVADPDRVAIYGASYGGYATMAGLAFTPELYRCGVNYVGVTDIELMLKTLPPAWESLREVLETQTGNARRDRERLRATSPLLNADKIRVPVFCAYGELDPRVDIKHATKLVGQLRKYGVPVELMTRHDEGHGYRRWDNKVAFYRKLEEFLAQNMKPGGRPPAPVATSGP